MDKSYDTKDSLLDNIDNYGKLFLGKMDINNTELQ
jgi:hypothetical protein